MEVSSSSKRRFFRSKVMILELLEQQRQSGLSIQAFCAQNSIPAGSFHNWKRKYGSGDGGAYYLLNTPREVIGKDICQPIIIRIGARLQFY